MIKNRICRKKRKDTGFTLMELLMVTAIMVAVTVSLYQALSNGIRIWERSRVLSVEEDILLFFERLSMDLYNASDFSLFEFEGGSQKVVFTTIVSVPLGSKQSSEALVYVDQIGRVEYGFDAVHKAVYRRQAGYGQAAEGKFSDAKILVQPVNGLKFTYFRQGLRGLAVLRMDEGLLPFSVGVQVDYAQTEAQPRVLKRLINLPGLL